MFSTIVLASIALASAQRAGQQDPALAASDLTHVADNTEALDSINNNGQFSQEARLGLFISEETDGRVGKFASLQNAGIELQDEDGEFIERNFLGAFVASEPCDVIAANRNGRGQRFQFNRNSRNQAGNSLAGQFLQLFNQRSVRQEDIDNNVLIAADFRFDTIRQLSDENVAELVDANPSVIIFQGNNVNNQLFCLPLVAVEDARNDANLEDLVDLVAFQEGTFEGFRVQDIVLTCDDNGTLEEIERGWGGVAGFGVFEAQVQNPGNPDDDDDLVAATTLLIDGIQVTQWNARHYGNYEAIVSDQVCNSDIKGEAIVPLEIDNAELRITDINLNQDNWHHGSAVSNLKAGEGGNEGDEVQEEAVSEGRIEQGSLREALLGSVQETAKGMFLVFDEDKDGKAVACCDLVDAADALENDEINIDFLNDVAEESSSSDAPKKGDADYNGHVADTDEGEDSAATMLFSVGAAALALVALF